ncbi:MAG: hypothetical protein IKS48_03875 [Eubacterium sp.]|nr:hypothetical protein [Eubacterium sp.]
MYNPSESEKEICYSIVRELLRGFREKEYEKIVDEIFQTTYSIGGDFGEHTLRKVANIVIRNYIS